MRKRKSLYIKTSTGEYFYKIVDDWNKNGCSAFRNVKSDEVVTLHKHEVKLIK